MPVQANRSLAEFLAASFTADELRRFIHVLPGGDHLVSALPHGGSLDELAYESVGVLERRGYLRIPAVFQALLRARPNLIADIVRLAEAHGVSLVTSAIDASEGRSSLVIVRADDALAPAERLQRDIEALALGIDIQIIRLAEWSPEFAQLPTIACAVLFTGEFMAAPRRHALLREVVEQHRLGMLRALPILVTSTRWRTTSFGRLSPLPGNSVPIDEWSDPDSAWAEVVRGVARAVAPTLTLPANASPSTTSSATSSMSPLTATPSPGLAVRPPAPVYRMDEVFRTVGAPEVNFVAPAQLPDLVSRISFMGQGLVVEGPSGIGKTTATRHALEQRLGADVATLIARGSLRWLSSKDGDDVAALGALLDAGYRQLHGHLVIDDFHRLAAPLQRRVADFMKLIADSGSATTKITVIGINPVGASLVQDFPDLAGRFAIVPMSKQPAEKIDELLARGERALNVTFDRRGEFVSAARGSFFTAQLLCYEAALREGVLETVTEPRTIVNGPDGVVLDRVLSQLKFKYHEPLLAFASYDEHPPPRGACLVLLWLLARDGESTVSLATAKNRYPSLAAAIDWLLASNLSALFARQPRLAQLLFYNRDAAVLSAEDPQLEFYLNNLHWPALARDSGHEGLAWDPERGFLFAAAGRVEVVATPTAPELTPVSGRRTRVLHLSDLHLDTQQHAVLWYGQLLADLRGELGHTSLDVVVLSGDISNRATAQEFEAAAQFLRDLQEDFKLAPHQFVLVPGNHDQNWSISKKSYRVHRREDAPVPLIPGQFIDKGEYVEIPDDLGHRARFQPFADLYYSVRLEPYTLDYEYQATVHHFAEERLLILGLNSAWSLDHHFRDRADIHAVALGRALRRIQQEPSYADCLKIAVWHHPVHSPDPDRLRDTGFVERLAQAGFRLGLHGHIHKPQQGLFRHDMSAEGRRIDFVGAGTFGAPTREWQPGYPLQYQILEIEGGRVRVESRRREEPNGAWKPDARFTQGPGQPPRTYYEIKL